LLLFLGLERAWTQHLYYLNTQTWCWEMVYVFCKLLALNQRECSHANTWYLFILRPCLTSLAACVHGICVHVMMCTCDCAYVRTFLCVYVCVCVCVRMRVCVRATHHSLAEGGWWGAFHPGGACASAVWCKSLYVYVRVRLCMRICLLMCIPKYMHVYICKHPRNRF